MEEESEKSASLINSLTHPDKKVIRQAAETLISEAKRFPELKERLGRLLGEAPAGNRWPVAYVLAHLSPLSPLCLDVLKETLGSDDPDVRWAVALLLVRIGKNDGGVVTHLLDLLKTGTPTQRRMAVYSLRDIGLKDAASLEAIVQSFHDPDPLVRVAAVASLKVQKEIGGRERDSVLHLFLKDPDVRVRHTAAFTLANMGAPTDQIRAALKDASRSDDPQLKKVADAALDLLQKKGPVSPAK